MCGGEGCSQLLFGKEPQAQGSRTPKVTSPGEETQRSLRTRDSPAGNASCTRVTSLAGRARSPGPPHRRAPPRGVWGHGNTLSNFWPGSFLGSSLSPTLSSPPSLSCQALSTPAISAGHSLRQRHSVALGGHQVSARPWPAPCLCLRGWLPTRLACCMLVAPGSCTSLDAHLLSGHQPEPHCTFHLGLRHVATPTACRLRGPPDPVWTPAQVCSSPRRTSRRVNTCLCPPQVWGP